MEEPTIDTGAAPEQPTGEVTPDTPERGQGPLEGSESDTQESSDDESGVEKPDSSTDNSVKLRREYTQSRQEVAELKRQNDELKAQFQELQSQLRGESTPDPLKDAVSQLDPYLREMGYMTRDEFERQSSTERARAELQTEISRLEQTYDGKNGLPKFDAQEVAEHVLNKTGSSNLLASDLELAYRDMYFDQIIDSNIKKAQERKSGTYSEKSDKSGQSQSQPSDTEMLQRAQRTGNYQDVIKRKLFGSK